MRVFITGATGFIGGHLARQLVERGDHVIALVRSKAKAANLPAGVETFAGDLSIFADPNTVLPACDVVIHLAGVVAADSLAQYDEINHVAVKHLVECLQRQSWKPARLVFASSLAAAGPSAPGRPWNEQDALAPIDDYGRAKAKAEQVVSAAPFPTTSFRPPIVFGPGDDATFTLFKSARSGIGMRIAGPVQELSFVDVRDLVNAIVVMADDRRPDSHTYYASHPDLMNMRVLWQELGTAVGKRVFVLPMPRQLLFVAMLAATFFAKLFSFKNQLDKKQYEQMVAPAFVCSGARLQADLGWKPAHVLADTLGHAAAGYRAAGRL